MVALISLLAAVTVSILVARVATTALQLTGLSREVARFQARSALTGTGFTTAEAEAVVGQPVRRRILVWLMIVQNAGLVTFISTFVLSFVDTGTAGEALRRGGILAAGLGILWVLARSDWLEGVLHRVIARALDRFTDLGVVDYLGLLDLEREHAIGDVAVSEESWLAGKTLAEAELPEEGVVVLGIRRRDGGYVAAPRGRYAIHEGDRLVLYGREDRLKELHARLRDEAGDRASRRARQRHEEEMVRQDEEELEYETRRRGNNEDRRHESAGGKTSGE